MYQHSHYRVPRRRRDRKGSKMYLMKLWLKTSKTDIQIQEAQGVPDKMKPNRPTRRHVIIKMAKVKEQILKAASKKQRVIYKRMLVRLSADISAETLQNRREWHDIFKVLKGKYLQPRILYPARLSFKIERELKNFSDKQTLKEFIDTKPSLKEMLTVLL